MRGQNQVLETNTINATRDRKGSKVVNQYTILQKIGEGAYGTVKLCKTRNTYYVTYI